MRKGMKTLAAGITLFVIGAFVIPFVFLVPLFSSESQETKFIIPSTTEVKVGEAGRYYLWNEYQSSFDGKNYSRPKMLPDGLEIEVSDEDGNKKEFTFDSSISIEMGGDSSQSVGYVDVGAPGSLMVSVSGETEDRVFSFSRSRFMESIRTILIGGASAVLLGLLGLGISILGVVKLVKGGKKPTPGPPPLARF